VASATTTASAAALTSKGRGAGVDRGFRWLALVAGLSVLVILGWIAVSTTTHAWPAISHTGVAYVFGDNWDPSHGHFEARALIYGSLVVSLIAVVVAVPVSIGIALFMTEVAPRRLRGPITTVIDLLAAVPSVVFGLWAFLVLRPHLKDIYNRIADAVSGIPVLNKIFGPSLSGMSFMSAGLIVALMITPIITSITREVFLTVPSNDKDGALALGATRWEMIKGVVIPHSSGGITGAVMLGLGRALGETIAIALIIGASPQLTANLFAQGEAMPSIIARNLNESAGTYQAALIGLGLVLFVLTLFINVLARMLVARFDRRMRGDA
jgi:phosphate transport system permease protein